MSEIKRDRWDRPLIIPRGGSPDGEHIAYTRTSRMAKAPDDVGGLVGWSSAQTLRGLVERRDLYEAAVAARGNDTTIRSIAAKAKDAARSDEAANTGTALHFWAEQVDNGEADLTQVPADYEPMISKYLEAMEGIEVLESEVFCVCDELQVGGTLDKLLRLPDGRVVVGDIKTGGSSLSHGALSTAIQTALYAHSERYDPDTGERSPLHPDLDPSQTILIHMPIPAPGEDPVVDLHFLDGEAGWFGARLAYQILKWRKRAVITPYAMEMWLKSAV